MGNVCVVKKLMLLSYVLLVSLVGIDICRYCITVKFVVMISTRIVNRPDS